MITRCLENHVFAVTCNRTGWEERGGKKRLTYIGNSEVVTPEGEILKRAKPDQEAMAVVEIDPLEARNKKINPYNDLLAGRRPEFYTNYQIIRRLSGWHRMGPGRSTARLACPWRSVSTSG